MVHLIVYQWLIVFLPFARLRFSTLRPVLVRNRDRKPCRRLRTRCEGLYVSRFAPLIWSSDNDGCRGKCTAELGVSSATGVVLLGCMDGRIGNCESIEKALEKSRQCWSLCMRIERGDEPLLLWLCQCPLR